MATPNTLAELAIAIPRSIAVFERLHIDYCCNGKRPIGQACSDASITVDELMMLIDAEPAAAEVRSWDGSTLTEMIAFINGTHHAYTRQACETLQWMSRKVATRHGDNEPHLVILAKLLGELIDDLLPHMMKEEQILFPYLEQLEEAIANDSERPQPFFGSARNPIRMMLSEHETVGEKLIEIRSATSNFALPEWACTTFTAYFNLLAELERDLHNHIHLENNILFPRGIELEESKTPALAVW
jgi:regulator of cell morphogenesis and NO signaling